jgi:hypothetical protein
LTTSIAGPGGVVVSASGGSTTAAPTTLTTSTPTNVAASSTTSAAAAVPKYLQCGGTRWTGSGTYLHVFQCLALLVLLENTFVLNTGCGEMYRDVKCGE